MIKNILVCTDGSAYGGVACEYAVHLARALEARLTGLHVLDSRMLEGPLMADISGWIGAQPFGAQLQQFRELLQQKGEAVINAFNALCEERGVAGEGRLKMGHPARIIIEEQGRTELLVIGQKGEHADLVGDLMGSNAERVVRHSANPCLVTPSAFRPITRVLAAYDGSGHASQALHEAVELCVALKLDLLILTVADPARRPEFEEIANDGARLAQAHGCTARLLVEDGDPEEVILEQADRNGCDLIVVGAYGHGRIREMFLGSTTTQLVSRADRPVLLVR